MCSGPEHEGYAEAGGSEGEAAGGEQGLRPCSSEGEQGEGQVRKRKAGEVQPVQQVLRTRQQHHRRDLQSVSEEPVRSGFPRSGEP